MKIKDYLDFDKLCLPYYIDYKVDVIEETAWLDIVVSWYANTEFYYVHAQFLYYDLLKMDGFMNDIIFDKLNNEIKKLL